MKKHGIKYISLCVCALLSCILGVFLTGCKPDSVDNPTETIVNEWQVKSPDGSLVTTLKSGDDGLFTYSVNKGESEIVEPSQLGMDIKEDDFASARFVSKNERRVTGSYQNVSGRHKIVDYDCNETTLTFEGADFYFDVTVRCYDEGFAFKYGIRKTDGTTGSVTLLEEKTQFAMPEKAATWSQRYKSSSTKSEYFSYECSYDKLNASEIKEEYYLTMPLLYKLKDKETYCMITASGLIGSGFYGSFLKNPEGKSGSGILQTVHNCAGIADDEKISYPFSSPWRLGIVGDLKQVNESELVEKLYDDTGYWRPDNYDELSEAEKDTYDYSWVEPGAVTWDWIYQPSEQSNYEKDGPHYRYVDLAAKHGWKYILVDGAWRSQSAGFTETKFKNFISYAKSKKVKVIVWFDAYSPFNKGDAEALRAELKKWADYGIAGIKIDFFDGQMGNGSVDQGEDFFKGEDIKAIEWYETIYQECAKLRLLVNCHGSNIPTGERRLYPHVLNREGVFGNENERVGASYTINQLIIRTVVGPTDFTPLVNPRDDSLISPAHQLSLSFLYETGLPAYGDAIEAYTDDLKDFYSSMPTLRDETKCLEAKLDAYYTAAVRSGEQWLVGSVCYFGRETTIDFSFLGDGEYTAEVFTDTTDENGELVLKKETITVTKNDKKTFSLIDRGGLVVRLVPKA